MWTLSSNGLRPTVGVAAFGPPSWCRFDFVATVPPLAFGRPSIRVTRGMAEHSGIGRGWLVRPPLLSTRGRCKRYHVDKICVRCFCSRTKIDNDSSWAPN